LEGDLFTSTNGLFKRKKVDPDPALEKGFWDANNAAIQLCEQSLKQNDKNQDALYSCGVAYAGRASYLAIIERSKFDTLSSARRAANYHNELSQLNPQCYDAHLIPGIYDFALGSLPHSLRMLLFLGGYTGDKERGLHAVEDAANRGNLARTDAQIFLAVMYRRERRYADAQRTLRDLAEAFPRNYIFQLEIASIHRHAGEDKEAIVVYEQMLEDVRLGKPGYAAAPVARIHYELADLYLKTANLASARSHVDQVAGSFGSTPELERQGADLRRRIDAAKQQPAKQETPAAGATLSSASIG
jgi:tetratricopeptide (TPR) repeat protein